MGERLEPSARGNSTSVYLLAYMVAIVIHAQHTSVNCEQGTIQTPRDATVKILPFFF